MDELRSGDPRWIGAYRLLGRLGTGGMGRVYLARSARGRTVAVKLVRAELAAQEEFRTRFRREVQAARRVGGTWTAPVLDADTEAEIPWVATGYVAGPSLQEVVGRDHGPLPERSVRVLAAGLAHALSDIHAAGLVHRDLKPSNVMITIDGPRVIDFGIARALETVADGALTYTGAMVGSPAFMSPEQVRGDRVTPACDIFCLGSVLAYAATGLQPFGAASSGVHAQMFRIVQEPPDLDAVPDGLRDLVAACLVKDPEQRPSLARVLEQVGEAEPDSAAAEPWLPGAIIARLGRHAVQLLELEAEATQTSIPLPDPTPPPGTGPRADAEREPEPVPEPEPTPEPGAYDADEAEPLTEVVRTPTVVTPPVARTAVPPPAGTAPPSVAAVPPPGPGPGPAPSPATAPQRAGRGRRGALVAAMALLAVIAGATTAFVVLREEGHKGGGNAGPSASPATGTSAPADSRSATPSAGPAATGVPADMVGTWETSFSTTAGDNTRTLTVHKDGSVELAGGGADYDCAWSMKVTEPGPPVQLSPSEVTSGDPATSCNPGGATTLTLVDPTHLRRDNLEGGKAPLTYEKVG
jgi:serine/threonine protein kinase